MGFSRQGYKSRLPCPPLGDLPDPGMEPMSLMIPASADRFSTTSTTWEAWYYLQISCRMLLSHSVTSASLWPHGLQHATRPCPSLYPGVCSNTCSFSWWCHPNVSSCPTFSVCPQSLQASGSFPMSLLFASSNQSIGASASILPMNIQKWLIGSPCCPRDSHESSPAP